MNIREMIERKMKEKQKKQRVKLVRSITAGAMVGIASGVVAGALLTPKSGKETRDDIAKTAKDIGGNAITKTVEMKEMLDSKVAETKNNATIAKEKIGKYLSDKKAEKNNNENENEVAEEDLFIEKDMEINDEPKTEE
jgi:gas vesicle protein